MTCRADPPCENLLHSAQGFIVGTIFVSNWDIDKETLNKFADGASIVANVNSISAPEVKAH